MKDVDAVDGDKDFQDNMEDTVTKRRAQDYEDLQNELADRETGRNARFLNKNSTTTQENESKRRAEKIFLSALEILLQNDLLYADRHAEVMDLLSRAEITTEQALQVAQQDLQNGQDQLDEMRGSANRLPEGTAVYRDAEGNVWTEDGRKIEGHELDGIVWKENAPSYEDILKQKRALEEARRHVEELRRYQIDVLGKHRDRMTDPDNPPSKDDMDDIEKDIKERAPESVRMEIMPEVETSSPSVDGKSFDTKGPPL